MTSTMRVPLGIRKLLLAIMIRQPLFGSVVGSGDTGVCCGGGADV